MTVRNEQVGEGITRRLNAGEDPTGGGSSAVDIHRAPAAGVTDAPTTQPLTSQGTSVTALLQVAVEKGTPVAELKELVALHERIAAREAAMQFVQALARFKAKLAPIVHTRKVGFASDRGGNVSYSYTELDELARHIDPGLTEEGFSYSWDQKFDGNMVTTTCILAHAGGHTRTASFTLPAQNNSAASPQQKIGMADTYASRRSLIAVLGLTTADTDPRPAEIDPTPISEDQAIQIEDMITETQANLPKFLKYMDVAKVADIPAVKFNTAIAALKDIGAQRKTKDKGAAR